MNKVFILWNVSNRQYEKLDGTVVTYERKLKVSSNNRLIYVQSISTTEFMLI